MPAIGRHRFRFSHRSTFREGRRLIIFVVGVAMILCGVVMLVIPGLGWLLILAGLSALAFEFAWARQLLSKLKAKGRQIRHKMINYPKNPA
jgi:tellurite resistance protein TerC